MTTDRRLILLSPEDNVLVVGAPLKAGEWIEIEGREVRAPADLALGHKLARWPIRLGEQVLKYGASIGRMTAPAEPGDHIHTHNLASEYIPTFTHANQRAFTGEKV